jgi:flagellar L-ring protein precursor FlgH
MLNEFNGTWQRIVLGDPLAHIARCAGMCLLACLTVGCGMASKSIVQEPTTARPVVMPPQAVANGAIFQTNHNYQPLFEDRRARNVGDTLVINVNEKTNASKKSNSSAAKNGSAKFAVPTVSGLPGKTFQGAELSATSAQSFDGKGEAAANNDFTGTITVTVTQVLANGNLLVSGEKQVALNQGTEFIRFSGVVNPNTITGGNAVSSVQVADARIEYRANGYIDEAQTMGWLGRFFLNVLPF